MQQGRNGSEIHATGYLRFGMLNCVLGMSVKRLFAVGGLKPFQEGEETGDADDGTHDIVHEGAIDNHVGPMKAMF